MTWRSNAASNRIYVVNGGGTVTVIDANNNNSVSTVNVGSSPVFAAVNSVTNKIYVPNTCGDDSPLRNLLDE